MINIKGKNKAEVLAALYNASRPLGLGALNPAAHSNITVEQAQKFIDEGPADFDYLQGRVIKVDLRGDEFDPWLYDRDNGEGAAARALGV